MASVRPSPQPLYVLRGMDSAVHAVAFSSSSTLVTGCSSGCVRVWSLKTLRTCYQDNTTHRKGILGFSILNEDSFWSHGRDGQVSLWSVGNGQLRSTRALLLPTVGFCRCIAVTVGERPLLCGAWNAGGEIVLLDGESGDVVSKFRPQQSSPCGMCMAVKDITSESSVPRLLSAHEDGHVRTWDLRNCSSPISSLQTHTDPIFCCAVDIGKGRGMAAGAQNSLVTFSLDEGGTLTQGQQCRSPSAGVTDLVVRSDSKLLLASLSDGRIMAYSWKSLKHLAVMSHHLETVHCVACGPAGPEHHLFAAGGKDSTVSLWSLYK